MSVISSIPLYRGRFAPSPTGLLHQGSLVAALASWLDARAHHGKWLVRIEDIDHGRCQSRFADGIVQQLGALSLISDETVWYQSRRDGYYQQALEQLNDQIYVCTCSRKNLEIGALCICNQKKPSCSFDPYRKILTRSHVFAIRYRVGNQCIHWTDRRHGIQQQNLAEEVGDFVVWRKEGYAAYQLAVVVDDAEQNITHIVRGDDLLDSTARQIALQRSLGYRTPHYLHTPLVISADGSKLSKQNGAAALNDGIFPMTEQQALHCLNAAAATLRLHVQLFTTVSEALAFWVKQWAVYVESDCQAVSVY